MKVHETTKEIKNNCEVLIVAFFITLIFDAVFVGFGFIMYAAIISILAAAFGFFGIIFVIKIHNRYANELLCKINNKKLLDYCECDFCKLARISKK